MKLRGIQKRMVMFCVNHFLSGTRSFGLKRRLLRSIGYEIGENTKIVGPVFCTGKLHIGSNCWIGRNFTVEGNGSVHIGDNCDVAPGVMFLTGGHEIGSPDRRAGRGETYSICVGSGTWLGARATIAGDVQIGEGCVVAACGCVVSNVNANSLVGGVPARLIRELDDESQENH